MAQNVKSGAGDHHGEDGRQEVEVVTEIDQKGHLRVARRIGLIAAISFVTGSVIGSGIFISPRGALANSGSVGLSLIVWVFCGVLSLLLALVYAELAVLVPKSGGDYTYIREGIGDLPGFLVTWVQTTLSHAGGRTVLALVFADYLCAPIFGQCKPPDSIRKTIAAVKLLTLATSNAVSVKFAASIQIFFTSLKVFVLCVITIGGLIQLFGGKVGNFDNPFHGTTTDVTSISLAIYSSMWAYSGFTSINDIAEELIEPKRNIPRALIISMTLITAIYITTNISYFTILSKAEFLSVPAVAYSWGDRVLGSAAILIPISVMCSVYGASNGGFFSDVRARFAAARAGHLPEVLSFLHNKSRIPVASVAYNTLICFILLIPGDIDQLINLTAFVGFLNNCLSIISLLRLKYQRRHASPEEGMFRLPIIVPILALIICAYMLISPFVSKPKIEFLYGVAFILSGIVFYFPFVYFKFKIPGFDYVTMFIQLLLEINPTVSEVKLKL